MKRNRIKIFFISSLVSLLSIGLFFFFGILDYFVMQPFDIMTKLVRKESRISNDIVVILIDETTLKAMDPVVGRWPWPRWVHAEVIRFLKDAGAKAIVFDILFTERSEGDNFLVEATKYAGNVIHSALIYRDEGEGFDVGRPLPPLFIKRFGIKVKGGLYGDNNNFSLPVPDLIPVSKGIGIVNVEADVDGVYRRIDVFRRYGQLSFPALFISPYIYINGIKEAEIKNGKLRVGDLNIPVDSEGRFLINNYGVVEAYSMSAVLKTIQALQLGELSEIEIDPSIFEGKIVFIGASAVGLEDLKNLPVGNAMPGVYMHVFALSNLIKADYVVELGKIWSFLLSGAASLFIAGIISFSNTLYFQILSIPLTVGLLILISYSLFINGYFLSPVYPVFFAVFSSVLSLSLRSATEGREKRKIKRFLEQYVSPAIVAKIVENYEEFIKAGQGKRAYISVLFADIRGFTALSEDKTPEEVVEFLNRYFALMSEVVFSNKGTLDKFIGDALMAFWGEPVEVENPSFMAVKTALEMRKKLEEFNKEGVAGFPPVKVGIGINRGYAVVGNIGYERKLDYTAIGDVVNTASRLENLTKDVGATILISQDVYKDVADKVVCRYVGSFLLRGKVHSIKVYEPLLLKEDAEPSYLETVEKINKGVELLEEGDLKGAYEIFVYVLENSGDNYLKDIVKRHINLIKGKGGEEK